LARELGEIVEIAKDFLAKAGLVFIWLEEAKFDSSAGAWRVVFQTGIARDRKKTVIVSDFDGKVMGYE